MEKQTIILDASSLNDSACDYHMYLRVLQGYRPFVNSINIEFGTAFHKFRQHFRHKGLAGFAAGIQEAKKHLAETQYQSSTKKAHLESETYIVKACTEYALLYEHDNISPYVHEGTPLLEMRFALPYYSDEHLDILLAGTMDEIAIVKNSPLVCIVDCKTTSAPWDKAASYMHQYQMSNQLLFYWTMFKRYGQLFPDTVMGKLAAYDPALMIDAVFVGLTKEVNFKRSDIWIPPVELREAYAASLELKLAHLKDVLLAYVRDGKMPSKNGIIHNVCTKKFGTCDYFFHCAAASAYVGDLFLEQHFARAKYNPLAFQT